MFKKGLVTLVCLTVMSALWAWAATTYSISTKITSIGTVKQADGSYKQIEGGDIKVRGGVAQTYGIKYSNFTTQAVLDVVVTPKTGYKVSALSATGAGVVTPLPALGTGAVTVQVKKPAINTVGTAAYIVATFAPAGATVTESKNWQLQVLNNTKGGSIKIQRPTNTDVIWATFGKSLVKSYVDTTPVTVTVTPDSGWNIDYLIVDGVKTFYKNDTVRVVTVDASTGSRIKNVVAGYQKKSLQVTTQTVMATTTTVDGAIITRPVANGIEPANPVADPSGTVRLVVTPTGSNNKVTGFSVTSGSYGAITYADRYGKVIGAIPPTGPVKVTITGITTDIAVAATYGFDAASSGQYSNCTQTCHADTKLVAQSVRDADTTWLASTHKAQNVDCVSCHKTMPGPDFSSAAAKDTLCASCHIAGSAPAAKHTVSFNSCSVCHSFDAHNPVVGAVPASISLTSAGTPDVVDAGDSYLAAPAEFAGSNACKACHADHFEGWTKSLHNKPTKYIANQGEAIIVNDQDSDGINDFEEGIDFNDPSFATTYGYANPFATQAAAGVAPILKKVGAEFVIQIGATEYKINRTQGGNGYWKQRYYTEVGGGNYVLPVQWNEVQKRYSVYNAQYWYNGTTPRFSQAYGSAELLAAFKAAYAAGGDGPASSSWENRCAGCHQSGLTVKVQDGEVVSGYADLNVGCEACHGPAAAHVAAPTKTNVINPNDFLSQAGGAYKAVETCGKCHQRGESGVYLGAGGTKAAAGTVGSIQKKIEAPAKLTTDLSTAIFFPVGGDQNGGLFGTGWYTDSVGVFNANNAKGSMTYNGKAGFPTYLASNQHHQQWEDLEQGKHGATYAENTPGATKMACWSCHDLHSPKGSHNTRSKLTVGGTTVTGLSAADNTLCLACHAGKGKFAELTLSDLAQPKGANVVAAVNAHVSARIPGKTITQANYLVGGRFGGGSSKYGIIEYLNGQCVACHMPLAPSSTGVRIYADAKGFLQGDQHSHTMKTILKSQKQVGGTLDSITSCSGCHGDFTDFVAEKLQAKTVELGQSTPGVASATGFVGTNKCQSCHLDKFSDYTKTLHNKPLKTIAALTDSIFVNDSDQNGQNDFKDNLDFNTAALTVFQGGTTNPWNSMKAAGNAPKLSYEGGKYYITIGAVRYEIFRTQGGNGKWKQRFHTKVGNAYYVLPVQYNEISKQYEAYNNTNWYKPNNTPWITAGTSNTDPATIAQVATLLTKEGLQAVYTAESLGTFPTGGNVGPSTSSWDNRCASCHQTGVAIEYKDVSGQMEVVASSADLNIGCESCHGAGEAHIKNPYAAGSIENPAHFTNKYRANEVCGQCHSRVEGAAHFSANGATVFAGIEAPSELVEGTTTKAKSYELGHVLLNYIEKVIPKSWTAAGVSATTYKADGTGLQYYNVDGITNKAVNGVAADGHHQQWHDLESGAHGASAGVTCFNCHDPHKSNSGNIRTSVKMGEVTVATKSNDNSLCLSCHAGKAGVFAALTAADVAAIAADPNVENVMNAVYDHLIARAGYTEASRASWKTKYLQSVAVDGSSATFGIAKYRVGECISCHMPFSAKSGIYSVDAKNPNRKQGDQRAHSMKTLWSGRTDLTATKGLTGTTVVTSCSACHPVSLTP